jgi:pyruvate,water dikinase
MLPAVLSPLSQTGIAARYIGGALISPTMRALDDAGQAMSALRAERPVLSRLSSRQLFDRAAAILDRWTTPLLHAHSAITAAALDAAEQVGSRCAALAEPGAALRLLIPPGGVDSAEPTWALWRLSRLVAGSPELTIAFDQGPDDVHLRLAGAAGDGALFLDQFEAFLGAFGSSGPNDWDLTSPTWETHPDLALVAVDRMRLASDDASPVVRHARLIADRRAMAPPDTALAAELDRAGRLLAARDRSKTTLVRMLHEARMPCYEIGRRMVEQGYLDRVADFGMVRLDEFPAFLDDPESFALTIRERRAEYEAAVVARPACGSGGSSVVGGSGAAMTGTPGSPGCVTGTVRVVTNPADPGPLQPGDIVVSPTADLSSLPLFCTAGAVIVEVGDWLQHAVVACREVGIPVVCACEGATTRLHDGAVVTVDGVGGVVTIQETATTPVRPFARTFRHLAR